MRTRCVARALWTGVSLCLFAAQVSWAQPGPEDGGAVVRNPLLDDAAPRPAPKSQSPPRDGAPAGSSSSTLDQILANLTVDPRYAINRDIQPTPNLGPWMICVHSYVTKEAPDWARQMASELRSNPKYRLPAYVFTYGLEDRHKEYLRVKELLDKQRDFAKEKGLPIMVAPNSKRGTAPVLNDKMSFPELLQLVGNVTPGGAIESDDLPLQYALSLLKVKHIQVQCAVLVGGYASEDAAHRAVAAIRKLPQPDPDKVHLDVKFYGSEEQANQGKLKLNSGAAEYVNPFARAFVCRNPSIQRDQSPTQAGQDGMDMKLLRKLNADEPLTLLNCKKPLTLAIKQFQTFSTTVEAKGETSGFLDKLGFKTRVGEGVDQAAHDAHNLADYLRQNQVEAYVLHTKYASIVTVGGYDSLEDRNLIAMQNTLQERLRVFETNLRARNPGAPVQSLMFFPRPMPMKVPQG